MRTIIEANNKKSELYRQISDLTKKVKWNHYLNDSFDEPYNPFGHISTSKQYKFSIMALFDYILAINWSSGMAGDTMEQEYKQVGEQDGNFWFSGPKIIKIDKLKDAILVQKELDRFAKENSYIGDNDKKLKLLRKLLKDPELQDHLLDMNMNEVTSNFETSIYEYYSRAYGFILGLCYILEHDEKYTKNILLKTLGPFNSHLPDTGLPKFFDGSLRV